MVQGLMWIIGTYALGALAVHAARLAGQGSGRNAQHYVLYTLNDGRHIEWAVRSLTMFYWLKGEPLLITIVDEGSTDDTIDIARSLSRNHWLQIHQDSHGESWISDITNSDNFRNDTRLTHIRLHHPDDWHKLPLVYTIH